MNITYDIVGIRTWFDRESFEFIRMSAKLIEKMLEKKQDRIFELS